MGSMVATKRDDDALRWGRAFVARQKKYKNYSATALNMLAAKADEIKPVVKDGVAKFESAFDKEHVDIVKSKVSQQFSNLPDITVRDYGREQAVTGPNPRKIYKKVKFAQLEDLREVTTGVTLPDPLIAVPEILNLVLNQKIIELCLAYYGAVPKLSFLKVRHAFAYETYDPKDTQLWHYDPGSFKLLKVLIYLNNVLDEGGGPFQFIKGTHFGGVDSPLYAQSRYSDKEIGELGAGSLFTGVANLGDMILCDATGIHRGLQPLTKDRTVLIANYCLHREYGFKSHRLKIKRQYFDQCSGIQQAFLDDLVLV